MPDSYDYIVVGAGSSGCVVAGRLSSQPDVRVLLLEAGPEARSPWIKIPGAVSKLFVRGPYNWAYMSEPEPALKNRPIFWPRGRGLGGSSAINGMVYTRGHRLDYDDWRARGNTGWSWQDVAPLFTRVEQALPVGEGATRYAFSDKFVAAARHLGFAFDADFNADDGDHPNGVGYLQYNIRKGVRRTSYDAFVAPVQHRRNLTVLTDARVERVQLTRRRATGVAYITDDERRIAHARREVILCGGAVDSPKLLMLSGIGPGAHLQQLGLDVVLDQSGVGANLHDHSTTSIVYNVPAQYTVNQRVQGFGLALEVARYLVLRNGVLALGTSQGCLFTNVSDRSGRPDIQIATRPFSFVFQGAAIGVSKTPTATLSVYHLRPESRGTIRLRSPDQTADPLILANFLQSPKDQTTVIAGVRLVQKLMATPDMQGFTCAMSLPDDDAELLDLIRGIMTPVYHPAGSCRMGQEADAVVDERLRVRGIEGLRVADASIMPSVVSANTNAACMMIGEKAAELILEDHQGVA